MYAKKGKSQIHIQEVEDRSLGEWLDDKKSIYDNPSKQLLSYDGYAHQDFYSQKW